MSTQDQQRATIKALRARHTGGHSKSDFDRWLDGETMEYNGQFHSFSEGHITFTDTPDRYRIKTPRIRAYTLSELAAEVENRGGGVRQGDVEAIILFCGPLGVRFRSGNTCTYSELTLLTWPDGSPCGVEEGA